MIKVVDINNFKQTGNADLIIGTHNGIFHSDEVVAIAILNIIMKNIGNIQVIRSRDLAFLKANADMLIDIGGGDFDHHQKGGNGARQNGVKYASAGLVWRDFGKYLISFLADSPLTNDEVNKIVQVIDEEVIQNVDLEDNGEFKANHPFKFVSSFLPVWNKENNYDEKFEQCINIVSVELENIVATYIAYYQAQAEIATRMDSDSTHIDDILVLPSQTIPWTNIVINYNNNADKKIDFVVFPYPAGGYALQCVPPSLENPFGQRIPLPISWAGETNNLPDISQVASATFCHNGRFFARAQEYDDIIKMCQLAKEEYLTHEKEAILARKD